MGMTLSLDDSDFKNCFIGGLFVIDCLEIVLTQNKVLEPREFKTSGFLRINPEVGVEGRFVLSRTDRDPIDPFGSIKNVLNRRSGTLILDSEYYKLIARDVTGNVWSHPAVNLRKDELKEAIILTVTCDYIRTESAAVKSQVFTHFIFLDELAFPKNLPESKNFLGRGGRREAFSMEASRGVSAGMDLTFDPRKHAPGERYSEFYALSASGVTQLMGFQDRLLESIRFCTATMATPIMTETVNNDTRIIELSKARPSNKGMFDAPLSCLEYADDFYRLLECYFKYACENSHDKEFAPISAKLGGLFTLKNVWLDTIALLVCVAIEGLLNEPQFKKVGAPQKTVLDKIDQILLVVENASVSKDLIPRISNVISSMKSSSTSDRFHALVQAGALDHKDRTTWKSVRNASAHGSFNIDPNKIQTRLDEVYRLITVVYKLVFLRIGYRGLYTNYAEHGWNVAEFQSDVYQANLDQEDFQKKRTGDELKPNIGQQRSKKKQRPV